ncbi:F-box protein At1g70590-like [Lolium rigidum]|uniref:F-box protein At1g70590-like n=1 Tax=Lolium rigidum TaxID=89674 RepID=UPI001F5DB88E|nr:F-box protein At1g70590-like [Lolium rigidum]
MEPLRECVEAQRPAVDQLRLTPLGKLARYANNIEGSSSGGSWRCLLPPIDDNNEEEEEEAPRRVFHSGNYVLNDEEDAMSNPAGRSAGDEPARPVRSALTRLARPPLPLAPLPSPPPPPAPNLRSPSSSREAPAPPKTAPLGSGSDFADLPQELLHRALSVSGAADVSAASRVCRAWRDALQPLREAAALHAHGRRLKHGPAVPAPCGVEGRDLARRSALGMFQRAARLGPATAMVDAGLLYWEEGQREEAMGYYRRAAELGHPVGMCNLGVSYLEADPPEADEAVRWFYPATSAGNVRAQYNLGLCLQNGKGIKRNQREAAKWYLRAAEGGNVRAMYNVSLCYCLGEGFTQDHVRAKKWLQLAADCGHKKALYECGLKLCAAGDKIRSFMYLTAFLWMPL